MPPHACPRVHQCLGGRHLRPGPRALNLYLDASALVKRYVAEEGSELIRRTMADADRWLICRVGLVETARAVGLAGGAPAVEKLDVESSTFDVVEVDGQLADEAAALTRVHDLRSLDALHLAAALTLPPADLVFASWDRRLHRAARSEGLKVLPESLDATIPAT